MASRALWLLAFAISMHSNVYSIVWDTDMGQYPAKWQVIVEGSSYYSYTILGLFNIQSLEKDVLFRSEHLNTADGIILVEAMRYAVKRLNTLGFLSLPVSFQITDCRESRAPFSIYQDVLVLNGMTSWQTTYYFITNTRAKAPMINLLAPSVAFDHVKRAEVSRKFKMDDVHRNVFRVGPSDSLEMLAIVDLLERLDWTFVSVVSSSDLRSQEKMENFASFSQKRGICISQTIWISDQPSRNEYISAAIKLTKSGSPKVVVLFTLLHEAVGVLKAVPDTENLTFVAGTSFRANIHDLRVGTEVAKGMLHLQMADTYDDDFRKYFMDLKFASNRYRWFGEFWSMVFNCSIPSRYKSLRSSFSDKRKLCTGMEDLRSANVDFRYSVVKSVLNAVDTFACALKESEAIANCSFRENGCTRSILRDSLTFIGKKKCQLSHSVVFNELGYSYKDYDVLNFNGSRYRKVGSWTYNATASYGALSLSRDDIVWRDKALPESTCYQPCPNGHVKNRGPAGDICCFTCSKCEQKDIVINDTCVTCSRYERPNLSQTGCDELPWSFIDSQYGYRLALIFGSSTGIVLNTVTIGTFVRFREYKIIKATGTELSLFILAALYLCFICPFIFIMKPSLVVCGIQRFIMGLSLNASYVPLMLKTSRIYRIFKASKSLVLKPSFVSTKSQVLIFIFIMCIEIILGVVWVVGDAPNARLEVNGDQVMVLCKSDPANAALNLLPCIVVMGACTFFGYKTRSFPSNFNEAFSITITMYISCFLWAMFIPLLFLFDTKRDNSFVTAFLTSYFMIILGLVMLLGIFGTTLWKLYIHKDSTPDTGQFFHSDNKSSFGSSTFSNIYAVGASSSFVAPKRKDVGTDPIEGSDDFKLQNSRARLGVNDLSVSRRRRSSF